MQCRIALSCLPARPAAWLLRSSNEAVVSRTKNDGRSSSGSSCSSRLRRKIGRSLCNRLATMSVASRSAATLAPGISLATALWLSANSTEDWYRSGISRAGHARLQLIVVACCRGKSDCAKLVRPLARSMTKVEMRYGQLFAKTRQRPALADKEKPGQSPAKFRSDKSVKTFQRERPISYDGI